MENIFSDDEEVDAFRDQLYDAADFDDKENYFPPAPRQDLFILGLEAPSSSREVYVKYSDIEKNEKIELSGVLRNNYSYFGLQQDRVAIDSNVKEENWKESRRKMLEKLKMEEEESKKEESYDEDSEEEEEEVDEEDEAPEAPVSKNKPSEEREESESPKLVIQKKRRRMIRISSSDDSDAEILIKSPQRKRVARH